jgi:hypothetical protein
LHRFYFSPPADWNPHAAHASINGIYRSQPGGQDIKQHEASPDLWL